MPAKTKVFPFLFIFIFLGISHFAQAVAPEPCFPGFNPGNIAIDGIPTYDYGPDNLVRFHYTLNPGTWYFPFQDFFLMDENCVQQGLVRPEVITYIGIGTTTPITWKAFKTPSGNYDFEVHEDIGGGQLLFGWWPYFGGISPENRKIRLGLSFDAVPGATDFVYTPGVFIDRNNTGQATKAPVLIVPGVLGTEMFKGDEELWANPKMALPVGDDSFMDPLQFTNVLEPFDPTVYFKEVIKQRPLFDYTKSLIDEFTNQGYTENQDLFTFPYDWRYGVNQTNVDALRAKIVEILEQTNSTTVHIIAHSTGGLLVKKYVMENPSDHHINKAVMVGVPNLGAPKATKVLLQGDSFGVIGLSDAEMKKIGQNLPVVYDLAPSPKYYDINGSFVKVIEQKFLAKDVVKDLNYQETGSFLLNDHSFNSTAYQNAQNLHTPNFDNLDMRLSGVDVYELTGCKSGTIGQVVEKRSTDIFGNTLYNYEQPKIITGDQTVPFESADSLLAKDDQKFYALKIKHGTLLSANGSRQLLVNLLTGSSLDTSGKIITKQELLADIKKCELKGKKIKIQSPLDIEVIDQAGNRLGFAEDGSLENSIPGADFNMFGDHKFVYLPEDSGEIYTINLKGAGQGNFTLGITDIEGEQTIQSQNFVNLPVSTTTLGILQFVDNQARLLVDNDGNGTIDETLSPNSILDLNQALDIISPISTSTLVGTLGQPSFYRSNVDISLSAFDPVLEEAPDQTSGVLKVEYNLDNTGWQTYQNPLNVAVEGQHSIQFYAVDNAGNEEQEQTLNFTIDKTPPEFTTQFNVVTKDFDISVTDNIDPNPTLICSVNQCTASDTSGNISVLKYEKKSPLRNTKNLLLKSISYNGQTVNFDPNVFNILYTLSGGNITDFSQTEYIKNLKLANILYSMKLNQSVHSDWSKGTKPVITKYPGVKFLQLETNNSKIKINLK